MPIDFEIRHVKDLKDLRNLREFVLTQGLNYPAYEAWVEDVCIPELEMGYKNGILAYSNGHVVGNAIYQPHKQLPRTREFKNMRIHPTLRRRDLGHFLLRQVEEEERETFDRIILDVRASEKQIIDFLRFSGYTPLFQEPLYNTDILDTVFVKEMKRVA